MAIVSQPAPIIELVSFLLLVLLTNITSIPTCPGKCSGCQDNNHGQLVKAACQDMPIQNLPATITDLRLSDATSMMTLPLGQLRPFQFSGKPDLSVLSVQRYNIRDIQTGTFAGCPKLTRLDLSNNLIEQIRPGTFQGLHKLEYLNLNNNKLISISADMFKDLAPLQELSLAMNKITVIPTHSFPGLTSLTRLDLQSNLIASIQPGAFKGLQNIEKINLDNNRLTGIQADVFPNLNNLHILNLQRNRLETLDPCSIYGTDLELLNLAQNSFLQLPPTELLVNISSQNLQINLARNQISELHDGDLKHVSLKVLYLVANNISLVHQEAFKDSYIQKLDLQQNNLKTLPEQMQLSLNKSTHMLLSNNPWSCDCDIQWLARALNEAWQGSSAKQHGQDPVCATPPHLVSWPIRMIINDLKVACDNHASIPVPTRGLPVPPKQDLITPTLQNQTLVPDLDTSDKGGNIVVIVTVCVLVAVALVVTMVIVLILLSRSKVLPDLSMKCKKPDINFRPRFSQWSLHEPLTI